MNSLMRMSYGRSGNRLERVLVSAPLRETTPNPRWIKILEVLFWTLIPVLIVCFVAPPSPLQTTVIDTSRLLEKPVIEIQEPVVRKPEPIPEVKPVMRKIKEDTPKVEMAQKPREHPVPSKPLERPRPTLVRPSSPRITDTAEYRPRITRERVPLETGGGTPTTTTRIRHETTIGSAPSGDVSIARTRGAATVNVPVASGYRVPTLRKAAGAGNPSSLKGTGGGVVLRPVTRRGRSTGYSDLPEGNGPPITASRERTIVSGSGSGGTGSSSVGLVRGVSLASLQICSSQQEEEDHIKAVLGVVGSRRGCSDGKGEFQFKGTKRISSFNLMIYPSKGRKPSNRCEELEYAYRCLTTH